MNKKNKIRQINKFLNNMNKQIKTNQFNNKTLPIV